MHRCRAALPRPVRPVALYRQYGLRLAHTTVDSLSRVIPVLHTVDAVAARALPPGQRLATLTRRALDDAISTIEQGHTRPVRVAVGALDPAARATDVVSALLDDPFSSDALLRESLRNRWQSQEPANGSLLLRHGETVSRASDLFLPSPWLRRTGSELLEVLGTEDEVILQLLEADVPLVVLSGMHSTRHLDMLSGHPTARIVLNNPLCSSVDGRRLLNEVLQLPNGLQRVHFVDASSALRALDVFQNTRDAGDVEKFQELYMNSRISKLARDLESEFALSSRERRTAAGVFIAQKTLEACRNTTWDALQRVEETRRATERLRQQIATVQREANDDASSSAGRLSVSAEVAKAGESLRRVMNSLRWWQLPLHLDDISYIVKRAVDSSWGIELEKKLAFEAGRLLGQQQVADRAVDEVQVGASSEFLSPVLANELEQWRSDPSAAITPATLAAPISRRRELINIPTSVLHRRAQSLVLSTTALSFASAAASYAAWAAQVVDAATAVGAGALVCVAGLRWAISRWEREQRKWWGAWDRIGQGLARDIQEELRRALSERVLPVPRRLSDRLEAAVGQRTATIQEVNRDIKKAQDAVDGLATRLAQPAATPERLKP